QPQVPFLDQILERETLADVAPGDIYDQAEIGADHPVARQLVPSRDAVRQFLFLVGGQQSRLVDLPEVSLQGALYRITAVSANTGHEDPLCAGRNRLRCDPGFRGRKSPAPRPSADPAFAASNSRAHADRDLPRRPIHIGWPSPLRGSSAKSRRPN